MSNIVPRPDWQDAVPHDTRLHTSFGFGFLAALLLGFAVWANGAPIAGAVVASGAFVTTTQNKTIQHLEGGVIRQIKVSEGDLVDASQVLVQLDETTPKAELRRLLLREGRLIAMESRLRAEAREAKEVPFPPALLTRAADDDIAMILATQRLTFEARRKNLASDLAVLKDGIDALNEKIRGSQIQRASLVRQLDLFGQEIDVKNQLLTNGLIRRSEVLQLQRAQASAQGEIGRIDGDIGDARERIARIQEQMIGARNAAIKTAVEQLHEVQGEQTDVRERIRSAQSLLDRVNIVAPVRGVVVKLRYHTAGGVVEAGKSIMELVPVDDRLVIEVRIRPQDIDHVKRGQIANVRLTALSQRVTPMISGEVVYVSADALPDDRRNQIAPTDQYVARIQLSSSAVHELPHFTATPGMPAEVYIKTSERTFFEYLTKPIKDSMVRAFREI
ncbi:HlyD family type I secretion periplasmic adaptor subunit [Methylobacterium sp. A54F]